MTLTASKPALSCAPAADPSDPAAAPASPSPSSRPAARTTIDDVARAAGVSKATVSRFLNRRDELLTKDIAQRVEAAIARLGYSPSPLAQSLKRGRSRLIGLVVADVTNPYSVAVLGGAEKACRDAGYLVMLFNIGNDDQREREAIEAMSGYQVEGFILHTLGHDAAALDGALRRGKPVVLIDRRLGEAPVDWVGLDNAGAVRLALDHLAAQGYRDVLFVTGPTQGLSSREERRAAFAAAQADLGFGGGIFEGGADDDEALDAALDGLCRQAAGTAAGTVDAAVAATPAADAALAEAGAISRPSRPAAVLTVNAVMTLRVAAAMARRGLHMGRDLGLIGFDDTDWAPLVGPGVSAIAQPTDDIGRAAVRCLLERLQGSAEAPREILLPGTLVARGSTRIAQD